MTLRLCRLIGRCLLTALIASVTCGSARAQEPTRHRVKGMVLSTDVGSRTMLVSHDAVEGVMGPMAMRFEVRDPAELEGIAPGATVTFTLVRTARGAHAEAIAIVPYDSVELDPMVARRLKLLEALIGAPRPAPLAVGATVPDFTLTDQSGAPVSLSRLHGQVVAVTFVYTSCALTQFCFRVTNHFASIARRFEDRLGRDMTLLTVTFDPARDTVDVLRAYASQWNAVAGMALPDRQRGRCPARLRPVRRLVLPRRRLMNHSLRTAVIDRSGRLAGLIEGNEYSAAQLGDLVAEVAQR